MDYDGGMTVLEFIEGPCTGQRYVKNEETGKFHRYSCGKILKKGYPHARFDKDLVMVYVTRNLDEN